VPPASSGAAGQPALGSVATPMSADQKELLALKALGELYDFLSLEGFLDLPVNYRAADAEGLDP
jgi:hypothetical protein